LFSILLIVYILILKPILSNLFQFADKNLQRLKRQRIVISYVLKQHAIDEQTDQWYRRPYLRACVPMADILNIVAYDAYKTALTAFDVFV